MQLKFKVALFQSRKNNSLSKILRGEIGLRLSFLGIFTNFFSQEGMYIIY